MAEKNKTTKKKSGKDKVEEALKEVEALANSIKGKKVQKIRIIEYKRNEEDGKRSYPYKGVGQKKQSVRQHKTSVAKVDSIDFSAKVQSSKNADVDVAGIEWEENNLGIDLSVLESLELLAKDFQAKYVTKIKRKSWKERMESSENAWEKERDNVLNAAVDCEFQQGLCQKCHEKIGIISCCQCQEKFLCGDCDNNYHIDFPFHNRVTFLDGYSFPLAPHEVILNGKISETERLLPLAFNPCSMCNSCNIVKKSTKDISVVITLSGRFELSQYRCICVDCNAVSNPFNIENIIKSSYWPSSPTKFSVLVKNDTFYLWDNFRKHMPGSSEKSFLDSLNDITIINGRAGKIVPSSYSLAFKEWCFCNYQKDVLQKQNSLECPSCKIAQHSCHVDGNCKLYRYRKSGKRRRESYYEDIFIVPDNKVNSYVESVYNGSNLKKDQVDYTCGGDWKAARNSPSKKHSVDITGLEVASCRHQFAQKAVNMHQGELYAYPLYIIKNHMVPNNVKFVFADVMCKLWKFIEKNEPIVATQVKGVLSVFHAKGHNVFCQMNWDGEWVEGTGRSTGEECEQLFSFLSRASNTTKYQRPENREETLTELVMFWNQRKTQSLSKALSLKYKKVLVDLERRKKEISDFCKPLDILPASVNWKELLNDVKSIASGGHREPPQVNKSQAIILLYKDLRLTPPSMPPDIKRTLDELSLPDMSFVKIPLLAKKKAHKERLLLDYWKSCDVSNIKEELEDLFSNIVCPFFERAMELCYFEKVHWKTRMKKSADTSKQRTIYRKKLSFVEGKLQNLFQSYVVINKENTTTMSDIDFGRFKWKDCSNETLLDMADTNKRILLESYMKMKRCEEELVVLEKDMGSFIKYYVDKAELLRSEIEQDDRSDVDKPGYNSLRKKGLVFAELQLFNAIKYFNDVSPNLVKLDGYNFGRVISKDNTSNSITDTELIVNSESEGEEIDQNESDHEDDLDANIFRDEVDSELIYTTGKDLYQGVNFQKNTYGPVNKYILPKYYSQSYISGRNGSNACTTICLITGYSIIKSNVLAGGCSHSSINKALEYFVGCLEVGNLLHEDNAFLTAIEASALLPNELNLSIGIESNATIDHGPKSLYKQLKDLFQNKTDGFIIVIACGVSVCCLHIENRIYLFDSHSHGENGAVLWTTKLEYLGHMLEAAFDIETNEYIYLCYVNL